MAESMHAAAGISAESSQATLADLKAACKRRAMTYGLL